MTKWLYSLIPLKIFDWVYSHTNGYEATRKFITSVDPELLESLSEKKVMKVYRDARRNIPAYRNFLKGKRPIMNIASFNKNLPLLDKENYVKKFSLVDRLHRRRLPKHGMLVESSGSSGKHPTNWFRTMEEEQVVQKDVGFESRYLFGDKEYIVISCWTLGAWTTSYSFCYYFEPLGVVKNIGPDVDQVVRTMKLMGTKHNYLIGGYPPFVKHLIDTGGLSWKKYNIDLVVGGEGFVPGWRTYMESKLHEKAKIISAYGASDLETGMGVETPLSQFIRKQFIKNPKKMEKIFGVDEVPLFFQYNPLRFYINNADNNEFHTTVLTPGHVGVKVKYNIRDCGGKLSYNEMIALMKKEFRGFSTAFRKYESDSLKLPFLWIAGRSDDVISIDGVNMYPQQIEMALLGNKNVYHLIQSFQISKPTSKQGENHFLVSIQLQQGVKPNKHIVQDVKDTIKKNLAHISKAYKLGLHDDPTSFEPHVKLFEYMKGPFEEDKIKNKYITTEK